jgi:N-acetylglucosaminyl-diphospho-decaprenol L-rhamnosyltransferase
MLSIIIVNFRNPPLLRLALRSLARVLYSAGQAEIIVIDSASTPETRNVVQHDCAELFERLVLVPFIENTGYTRGVNEGLKHASGEFLLILNPDIIVLPGTLEQMMQYMRSHPKAGLIGPGLLNFDDSRQDSCFRFYTPLAVAARRIWIPFTKKLVSRFLMRDVKLEGPSEVDWLMGSALMTSRKALDVIGQMDEQFFLYLSEVDWARRFWENGYTVVYLPTVQMYHYHQRQSKGRFGIFDILFRRETRWHIADALRYFKKNGISGQRPKAGRPIQPELLHA